MRIEYPDLKNTTLTPIVYRDGINVGIFRRADTTEGWVEMTIVNEIREKIGLPIFPRKENGNCSPEELELVRLYGKVELVGWEDLYEGPWNPPKTFPVQPDLSDNEFWNWWKKGLRRP